MKFSLKSRDTVSGLDVRLKGIDGELFKLFERPRKVALYLAQRYMALSNKEIGDQSGRIGGRGLGPEPL
jgi:hypothetical protein